MYVCMLARYMPWPCVCPLVCLSVCLSHVRCSAKKAEHIGSCKQRRTRESSFRLPKTSGKFDQCHSVRGRQMQLKTIQDRCIVSIRLQLNHALCRMVTLPMILNDPYDTIRDAILTCARKPT